MYYNNRAILDKENFNRIYEKIEKIDREKIEEFLYNKTKVNGYLNDKNIKNFEKMLDLKMKRWYYNKCTKEISENAHKSKKTAKLILYFLH